MNETAIKEIINFIIIILVSMSFPLLIYCVFLIHPECHAEITLIGLFAAFICFIVLPVIFLFFIIIPKRFLPVKDYIIQSIFVSFFFWILFLSVGLPGAERNLLADELKFLDSYSSLIDNLYKYKTKNSFFPAKLDEIDVPYVNKEVYKYTTYKNNKDFILGAQANHSSNVIYYYCSSDIDEKCHSHSNKFADYTRLKNNWIRAKYNLD